MTDTPRTPLPDAFSPAWSDAGLRELGAPKAFSNRSDFRPLTHRSGRAGNGGLA